jgi:hypothetical protein
MYTAYTSTDGTGWQRGATWNHDLGTNERIGLASMGGSGFTARFDYVRAYALVASPPHPDEGPPGEVAGVTLTGSGATTIAWNAAPLADVYDVERGLLSEVATNPLGTCFADDVAGTQVTDASAPPVGNGYFYSVRGVHVDCGGASSPSACP